MAGELWRQFEGQIIDNKYHLQSLINTGSYGGVFLADHMVKDRLIRRVAVKLMMPEGDSEELLRELIEATNLHHQNLLRCFDAGQAMAAHVEVFYLVMEIATDTLAQIVKVRPLAEHEAREWSAAVVNALQYLHARKMVHCDVKPANLLRVGDVWKISDFGLLRPLAQGSQVKTRSLLGSAAYMPPEGYDGVVTPAWDVWSFGITMVEALTQRRPFQGQSEAELQRQILGESPWIPQLPAPFGDIARGCLTKDYKRRWTLGQIQDALRGNNPGVTASQGHAPGGREVQRIAWLWGLALLPLLLLGIVLFAPRQHRETTAAEQPRQAEPVRRQPEERKPVPVAETPVVPEVQTAPAPTPPPVVNEREEKGAIYALLDDWVDSVRNKNLAQQVNCYAPLVRRYFNKRDVNQSMLQVDKQAAFSDFEEVRQFDIKNVAFQSVKADEAVVVLDKDWDTVGRVRFAGSERERLTLAKIDGRWKIASEEEQQIYWVKREKQNER